MAVVLYEKKGKVVTITLNRPEKRNAINGEMEEALNKAWLDFRDDDDLWVAILTGAGTLAFTAGMDLKEASSREISFRPGMSFGGPTSLGIWKPIIGAINGACFAGGMLFAVGCDIRIASENALFCVIEPRIGLPPLGINALIHHMPLGMALELMFTGDTFDAHKALELGFVNKVVSSEELMPTAMGLAEHICENAPLAVRATKELVCGSLYPAPHVRRGMWDIVAPATYSEDIKEGFTAFVEKRPPIWKGI